MILRGVRAKGDAAGARGARDGVSRPLISPLAVLHAHDNDGNRGHMVHKSSQRGCRLKGVKEDRDLLTYGVLRGN